MDTLTNESSPKGTTFMGEDHCPHCKTLIDCATSLGGKHVPKPKDLTLCIKCGTMLQYEDDMALGLFPELLLCTLDPETQHQLLRAQKLIRMER